MRLFLNHYQVNIANKWYWYFEKVDALKTFSCFHLITSTFSFNCPKHFYLKTIRRHFALLALIFNTSSMLCIKQYCPKEISKVCRISTSLLRLSKYS